MIAQPFERLIEGFLRHAVAILARPGQKVGDKRVEPHVVRAIGRPEAKGAIRILPRQQTVDGVA